MDDFPYCPNLYAATLCQLNMDVSTANDKLRKKGTLGYIRILLMNFCCMKKWNVLGTMEHVLMKSIKGREGVTQRRGVTKCQHNVDIEYA